MKLVIKQLLDGSCRLGQLTELGRHTGRVIDVPGCLMYTRGASAPHLTQDMAKTIDKLPFGIQLTLPTLAENHEVIEDYKLGIGSFTSQQDSLLFLSVQDPGTTIPSGYNEKQFVSIWTTGGRMRLSTATFTTMLKNMKPDWFECLYDGDVVPGTASKKRIRKSVDRTLQYLDDCLEVQQNSPELKNIEVFGVIEGGDSHDERIRSAKETAKRPLSGFVLDGFQSDALATDVKQNLMMSVLKELPEDKPRLIHGCGRPDQVMQAVELGIDVFDSAFPYSVTESGCALVFPFSYNHQSNVDSAVLEQSTDQEKSNYVNDNKAGISRYEINLTNESYKSDFTPLLADCKCYSCQNHTKAYINHLLVTKELLARVLLMIHNFHHYFEFFETIRQSIRDDKFQQLKKIIMDST
ncbi:queuine tRNA-ribosyltransferase accessory subunit 2-like [Saccoglossus kowalevskii]|uniref:Queuine tRNA-ribosyltransferase accessory subunit 2 n=1 Tax=Saccoglossus kowalevskii TaxID=10224 RepID=A0ABM0GPY0_SACKO|nr:PREDICTED: queuine tRNA-ribosyltransferase subunit QTRTD1-like [Saccoglossus kowalevskii]